MWEFSGLGETDYRVFNKLKEVNAQETPTLSHVSMYGNCHMHSINKLENCIMMSAKLYAYKSEEMWCGISYSTCGAPQESFVRAKRHILNNNNNCVWFGCKRKKVCGQRSVSSGTLKWNYPQFFCGSGELTKKIIPLNTPTMNLQFFNYLHHRFLLTVVPTVSAWKIIVADRTYD